jgi:hypothetical protein
MLPLTPCTSWPSLKFCSRGRPSNSHKDAKALSGCSQSFQQSPRPYPVFQNHCAGQPPHCLADLSSKTSKMAPGCLFRVLTLGGVTEMLPLTPCTSWPSLKFCSRGRPDSAAAVLHKVSTLNRHPGEVRTLLLLYSRWQWVKH